MKELSIEEKAKRYDEAKYIMEEYLKSGNAGVIAENTIKHAFPELKESEDERIVKELLTFFRESIHGGHILTNKEYDSWIAWLEKQGEQKTADKAEQKFEIGDLITNGILVGKIDEIHKWGYHAYFGDHYADVPDAENWHKWTVQDAKDGDVLCCESGWTCIFKALNNHINTFSSYCFMDRYKWFCNTGSECYTLNKEFTKVVYNGEIKPATKEQRDLLFQKMKEAGYEWDAEKKKLRKIEQKPYGQRQECTDCQFNYAGECKGSCQMKREKQASTWGEEELDSITAAINNLEYLKNNCAYHQSGLEPAITFLKSLKDRVQPKQEWSDVDKDILFRTIDSLKFLRDTISKDPEYSVNIVDIEREITLLESLRERYIWKPSDEQMKALGVMTITGGMPYYAGQKLELINLYNELKKLKRE